MVNKSGTRVGQERGNKRGGTRERNKRGGTREWNKRGEQESGNKNVKERWDKTEPKVETKESDKHEASKKKKVRR